MTGAAPAVQIGRRQGMLGVLDVPSSPVIPPPPDAIHAVFRIPRLTDLARHAIPNVLEGTVIPVGVFLVGLHLIGVWGAISLGLIWVYGLIALRLARRRRLSGLLLLGGLTITARTVIAAATGSVFLYFLQPSLGTALIATVFLVSVPLGRPLAERLARDFVPIPTDLLADRRIRRFFVQISLLWGVTQLLNASLTIWLLVSQSISTFVVTRTATSLGLTGLAILASTLWFRCSMRRCGIPIHFGTAA